MVILHMFITAQEKKQVLLETDRHKNMTSIHNHSELLTLLCGNCVYHILDISNI